MRKILFLLAASAALVLAVVWWSGVPDSSGRIADPDGSATDREDDRGLDESGEDRRSVQGSREGIGAEASIPSVPAGWPPTPTNAEELRALVAQLRSMPREELLRLSNAEFEFEQSALMDMLQDLHGEWVVPALGELAVGEGEPLLKAVLVEGLCGGAAFDRVDDARYLPVLQQLVPQFILAEDDTFRVGRHVITSSFEACLRQSADYVALVEPSLRQADNPLLLISGYDLMASFPGAEPKLREALFGHASAEGRLGALEGLRKLATHGQLDSTQLTQIGLDALHAEGSDRNRLLLVEMIGASGGEAGIDALTQMVSERDSGLLALAAGNLALHGDPTKVLALFDEVGERADLSEADRAALYNAMATLPGEEAERRLLDVARDPDRSEAQRLQGLQALWNREVDETTATELRSILDGDEPPALRAEALRMLAMDERTGTELDLRALGAGDEDPAVRSEAIVLASATPGRDVRGWLEECLLNDRSQEVRATALGALVMHAHYAGDGAKALEYLSEAKRLTDDPDVLAMIDRGEALASDFDPRRLEIELQGQKQFYDRLQSVTSGASARQFQLQAEQYRRAIVAFQTSLQR